MCILYIFFLNKHKLYTFMNERDPLVFIDIYTYNTYAYKAVN